MDQQRIRKKLYVCSYPGCGKDFSSHSNFEYHMNWHNGVKPYRCVICSKSFRNQSHLNHHNSKDHNTVAETAKKVVSRTLNPKNSSTKSSASSRSSVKNDNVRSLHVQMRPGDQNLVRIYQQQTTSLFWKRSMRHLFKIPFHVINPKSHEEARSLRFWRTPWNEPYKGFVPITKLPAALQPIHQHREEFIKAKKGWHTALMSPQDLLIQLEDDRACVNLGNTRTPSVMEVKPFSRSRPILAPTQSVNTTVPAAKRSTEDSVKCPFPSCFRIVRLNNLKVHIATHKGFGFRIFKCKVCAQRYLSHHDLDIHCRSMHWLTKASSPVNFKGMPKLIPEIDTAPKPKTV